MTIINPGLRMVRRSVQSVQIGLGAGGLILAGLQKTDISFVDALRQGIPDGRVLAQANALGVDSLRAQEICDMLSGLLFSDAELSARGYRAQWQLPERSAMLGLYQGPCLDLMERRERSVVQIVGLGRTGAALAALLCSAGVGTLLLEDDAPVAASDVCPGSHRSVDIGLARSLSVRRHVQRIDAGCQAHVVRDGGAGGPDTSCLDLAVVVGHDAVTSRTAARFLAAERPHLFVLLREQDGTIGPLVFPGETACAECVERSRSDHDPQWLEVCSQLSAAAAPSQGFRPRHELLENVALATTLAGTAATHALLFLDGVNQPGSWSAVLTFHAGNGQWTRQEFSAHPACGCQWQNQSLATIPSTASP